MSRRLGLAAILALFALLAVRVSLLVPLFELPDEKEHLDVVRHWVRHGTLPDLTAMLPRALDEGVQPPLAYWMLALGQQALGLDAVDFLPRRRTPEEVTEREPWQFEHGADELFPFEGCVLRLHLLRLVSVAWGLLAVAGTYALGRALAPQRPAVGLLAAGLVAVNPQFEAVSATLSNDALAVALSTWSLAALLHMPRRALLLGALLGLATLAKLTALVLVPVAGLALLVNERRLRPVLLLASGFLLVSGFWFAFNVATYGDPFAWSVGTAKFLIERGAVAPAEAVLERYLPRMLSTWAPAFGAHVDAGALVGAAWSLTAVLALLGLLVGRRSLPRRPLLWLTAALLLNLAAAITFYLDFNQSTGRYLFPTLGAACALLALGLVELSERLARERARIARALPLVLVLGLGALTLRAQVLVLGPAYAPPSRLHDPWFSLVDPLQGLERRESLVLLEPADGAVLVEPPRLRWMPGSVDERYTVHVSAPGIARVVRSYEDYGSSQQDRWRLPGAELWELIPPGVPVELQVLRLPRRGERALEVEASPRVTVRRAVEAAPGIEPGMTDLQSVALPLGDAAPSGPRR